MSPHSSIQAKIAWLIRNEGKTPSQAAGQAYGMARSGDLGEKAKREAEDTKGESDKRPRP